MKLNKSIFDVTLLINFAMEIIPKKFFDHLTGTNGLYKIRIEFGLEKKISISIA